MENTQIKKHKHEIIYKSKYKRSKMNENDQEIKTWTKISTNNKNIMINTKINKMYKNKILQNTKINKHTKT